MTDRDDIVISCVAGGYLIQTLEFDLRKKEWVTIQRVTKDPEAVIFHVRRTMEDHLTLSENAYSSIEEAMKSESAD
jgi:hypothetical protein